MEDKIQAAFAQIQADDALIDDTLAFLRKEAARQPNGKRVRLATRFAAVMAMALLVVGLFSYNLYFTAASHISIDVNPSLELTLNRFDRVIDAYAFNEDGANVLSKINLQGKSYNEAAELLLSAFEADGYIANNALVSVTVQAENKKKEQALCEALLRFVDEKMAPVQVSAEIEVFPVSSEIWSNAHGCYMSPARFLAIQELMEVDESATIEDYTDTPIRQIRQRTQECRNSHKQGNGSSPEYETQNGQGHGQGSGHGHGYKGGH